MAASTSTASVDLQVGQSKIMIRNISPYDIPEFDLYFTVAISQDIPTVTQEPEPKIYPWPNSPIPKYFQLLLCSSRIYSNTSNEIMEVVMYTLFQKAKEAGLCRIVIDQFVGWDDHPFRNRVVALTKTLHTMLQQQEQQFAIVVAIQDPALFANFISVYYEEQENAEQHLPNLQQDIMDFDITEPANLKPMDEHYLSATLRTDEQAIASYLLSRFKCKICNSIPDLAVESGCCQNLYCHSCVEHVEICPTCNGPIQCTAQLFVRRIIRNMPIQCVCGANTTMHGLTSHKVVCPQQSHDCPACNMYGSKKDMLLHLVQVHANEILEHLDVVFQDANPDNQLSWQCQTCHLYNLVRNESCSRCKNPR